MAAVNWTDPSEGLVIDPKAALTLENRQGGALRTRSRGIGVFAVNPPRTPPRSSAGPRAWFRPWAARAWSSRLPRACWPDTASSESPTVRSATARPGWPSDRGRSACWAGRRTRASAWSGGGDVAGVEGFSHSGNGVSGITRSLGSDAGVYGYGAGDLGAGVRGVAWRVRESRPIRRPDPGQPSRARTPASDRQGASFPARAGGAAGDRWPGPRDEARPADEDL